ncbi:N-acetylmuramidase domain-containing protein [Rhizobium sp. 12,4]|uniref:N-acetylmuramidase domain-containing protein n=1 Tax=Rhizobium sp. 12,4 TaxID=3405135 RepID=UPI003D32682B
MFSAAVQSSIETIAADRRINPAALKAVCDVESGGVASTRFNGVDLPLIRIEGHYFDKLVPADKRDLARDEELASPIVGKVKNPSSQEERYLMFQRMLDIDRDAAISSCSWGVGQVMGLHWKDLGFSSPDAFRLYVCKSVSGQVEVMVRFIERNGLLDEIERQDWAGFARGYNGPAYRKNRYDRKLADAFAAYGGQASISPAAGMLRLGSRGAGVREIQTLLVRAGYAVTVDGDFGVATRDALKAFQQTKLLTADGVAGPKTMAALKTYQVSPTEAPGALPAMQVPQVQTALKGMGPVALITGARDQISDAAVHLAGNGSMFADSLANYMLAGASVIGLGLTAYALWGMWHSRKTVEQG